jgi:competence protein ComEC
LKLVKFPLIPCVLFLALGIITGYVFKTNITYLLPLLTLSFIGYTLLLNATKINLKAVYFGIATYCIVLQIGAVLFYTHYEPNDKNHYSKIMTNDICIIHGTIQNAIKPSAKKNKYIVELNAINGEKSTGKFLLYFPKDSKVDIILGSEIHLKSKLYPIKGSYNPYQFDYAKYMEKQNIFHQVYGEDNNVSVIRQTKNLNYYLYTFRNRLSNSFAIQNFTPKTQAILNALLFGQRILLDSETIAAYSNTGVIHILAISGLHVGIFFLILNFLLKPLNINKRSRLVKLFLILLFLWSFAFISGLSASVTRAVIMFSILSIGKHYNQQNNTLNAIAVSAFLLLCYNPNYIFDVGFQLSYAAVIAIVLLNPFFKYFYFTKNKIINYSIDIILVSISAQIGVLPLSIYYFNQFPVLFLVANIVVIPLTTIILFAGLATLVITPISAQIALILGKILSLLIELMNSYIIWVSQFENFLIKNISFTSTLCFLAYITITLFIYFLYHKKAQNLKYLLFSVLAFQLVYIFTNIKENNAEELIIFSNKNSLITIKEDNSISAYTNSPETNIDNISSYKRGTFTKQVSILPLENILLFNETKLLIIDSLATYKLSQKPDIIILTQGTRVNLERVLKTNKPKVIIADNSNSKYKVEMWKKTCAKEKIPFHSTYEKGLYKISK